mmetsp:Transcript_18472/g.48732  ORF Transcript_18472/g.48732 Transcript_18472/m.48732 type:complete len:98 (+) Transcript_18472:452-745(+)
MERFLEGHAATAERFVVSEHEGYCARVEAMAGSYAAAGDEGYKADLHLPRLVTLAKGAGAGRGVDPAEVRAAAVTAEAEATAEKAAAGAADLPPPPP